MAGCGKERVIVPWAGRRNCLVGWFRRTGSDSSIGISQFFRVERLCHLETTRESAILVSLRFDCPTPGASIVYAVNKLAQAKRTGTPAPIVPLALTMMPLEGLLKMLFGMLI